MCARATPRSCWTSHTCCAGDSSKHHRKCALTTAYSMSTWCPGERSSDWAHDGGHLPAGCNCSLQAKGLFGGGRVDVRGHSRFGPAETESFAITAYIRNNSLKSWIGRASFRIIDPKETGTDRADQFRYSRAFTIKSAGTQTQKF